MRAHHETAFQVQNRNGTHARSRIVVASSMKANRSAKGKPVVAGIDMGGAHLKVARVEVDEGAGAEQFLGEIDPVHLAHSDSSGEGGEAADPLGEALGVEAGVDRPLPGPRIS